MKKIFYLLVFLTTFSSCKTSRDYLSRSNEDQSVFDAVKWLNKHPTDANAITAIPLLYAKAQERHNQKIALFETDPELSKYDKLFKEYNILQNMYAAIITSEPASKLLTPVSYDKELNTLRKSAAQDYYLQGFEYLDKPGRDNARMAYMAFDKSTSWIKKYKDADQRKEEAYQNGTINILVNTIQDNSFSTDGWGNSSLRFTNETFQHNLIRDLGGAYAVHYPAKFYDEWNMQKEGVNPDWIVDLNLRYLDLPKPSINFFTRPVSKNVEVSKDTLGRPVYQTVYANLYIQKNEFRARAQMELVITDRGTRKTVYTNTYSQEYHWEKEYGKFEGDGRALSSSDWAIINNKNYNDAPAREEVIGELYRKLFPDIKYAISNRVAW